MIILPPWFHWIRKQAEVSTALVELVVCTWREGITGPAQRSETNKAHSVNNK